MVYDSADKTCKDRCTVMCGNKANVICTGDKKTNATTICSCDTDTMVYDSADKTCKDRCTVKCGNKANVICTGDKKTDLTTTCSCDTDTMVYDTADKTCKDRCIRKCGNKANVICTGDKKTDATTTCSCDTDTMFYDSADKTCKDRCTVKCGNKANVICTGDKKTDATTTCSCDTDTMVYDSADKTCKDRCTVKCGNKENVICKGDKKTDATTTCSCDTDTMVYDNADKTCKDRCTVKCGNKANVICKGDKKSDATTTCSCDTDTMVYDNADRSCKVTCVNDEMCGEFKKCKESPSGVKMCSCPPGKSGEKCDVLDDCTTGKYKECKGNNGNCKYNDAKEAAECDCGSVKKWDVIQNLCRGTCSDNCTNSGECKEQEDGQKFCRCKQGTSGDFCKTVDGCKNDFCGTNREVVDCVYDKETKGPSCKCKDDNKKFIRGEMKCRKTCSETSECKNEGTCKGQDPFKLCECKPGTSGDTCEIIKECKDGKYKSCKGENAECTFEDGKPVCKCSGDKKLDELKGQCRKPCDGDGDCKNDAKCKEIKDGLKFCECKSIFTGDMCDKIKDCEEGGSYAGCKGENGECKLENGAAVCKCSKEQILDKEAGYCKYKWCYPESPCKDKNAVCLYDKEKKSGTCSCNDKKTYYDYSTNLCTVPVKCILKKEPCGENRECKAGSCKCINKYKEVNGTCTPNFCDPNPCFGGAKCEDTDGNLKCTCEEGKYYDGSKCADGTCFLGDYKTTCKSCPEYMKAKEKDKPCEPKDGFTLCSENCGYGYCLQKKDEDYICSCISSILTNHKNEKNSTCILKERVVCGASNKLTKDLDKCNCTGKYKLSSNGITCELKTCLDESAKTDCRERGARCVMDGKKGYDCKCPPGYVMDTKKKMCTDPCSLERNKVKCLIKDQLCYNSLSSLNSETGDCKCPPPFKTIDGNCKELAENVYVVTSIPVIKTRYEVENKINKVLLNADLINSMKSTFKNFDHGYLLDYQRNGDILNVSVWIQFKSESGYEPEIELNRIPEQTNSFECDDCNSELNLWPPFVLLDKKLLDGVNAKKMELCHEKSKSTLCGKEADCEKNMCSCPRGFKTVEYSIREIIGKFRIERCEDIDECISETHSCSINTTCVNLPGDYYCQCNANYKKEKDPVHSRVIRDKSDCYDLCTPNPCNKGTCFLKEDKSFDCKCPLGTEGSFCDNADVSLASAKKSTVIVGAILGTILGIALIALFLLYRRMKKNSYSEDFAPAPRQDREAEMMERRPVRGMINKAYE